MRRIGAVGMAVWLVAGVTGAARAGAGDPPPIDAGTPDGRVRATASPQRTGPASGQVRVQGNAGAFGFDNTVQGSPSGLRVTNPPMAGAGGTSGLEREELYGPSIARAALGTGGLTAGFGATGVLTNLAWPGPGFYDHVDDLNSTRGYPNQGAPENAGSFGGLLLSGANTWFTEGDGWRTVGQAYEGDQSGVLRTELANDRLGLAVTIRDVVHPRLDVLARHFEVRGAPPGSSLAYYANMNPTTSRVPKAPSVTDGLADDASDFATLYDGPDALMLHFRPYRVDPAATTIAVTGRLGRDNAAAAVDGTFGPGVYVAVGGERVPSQEQAGLQSAGLVRSEAEGTPLLDPFYDARDGRLSGSRAAFGKTAGAQAWPVTSGTVYLAASDSARGAAELVARARRLGFERVRAAAERDWARYLDGAAMPAGADAATLAVARRALMLIRTAQDRRTGAIVANVTTQTPYRQDWLRDGSFFDLALLTAGTPQMREMVRRHDDFYRRAQSEDGHWSPILCADGAHCDAVFPFEIDAQAFGVWNLWLEYQYTGDLDRLRENYDAIRRGAEVLWACRDPATGLQCPASEDDTVQPTQGAQGASTVYLGLRSAARAARLVGDPADAARWDARATELRDAARARLCDARTCQTGRGYMIWPSGLLLADADPAHPAPEDPRLAATLDAIGAELADRVAFRSPAPGGFFQYPMEPLFGLSVAWRAPDRDARLAAAVRWLTRDVVEPGVDHYAERIYHLGGGRYLHTVGFPHVWSGAEMYLAAVMVNGSVTP